MFRRSFTVVILICSTIFAHVIDRGHRLQRREPSLQPRARVTYSCSQEQRRRIASSIRGVEMISSVTATALAFEHDEYMIERLLYHLGSRSEAAFNSFRYLFMGLEYESRFTEYPRSAPSIWKHIPIWCRDLQRRCSSRTTAYVIDGSVDNSRTGFVVVRFSFFNGFSNAPIISPPRATT